jgi:ribA/ribD-fused uncharacterized protein
MRYNNHWLIDQYTEKDQIDFLFFYGHTPKANGTIGPFCLSQWWVAPFSVDGISYKTAEHWMMAEKSRLFKDEKTLKVILAAETPADVKKAGRLVQHFDVALWDAHKFGIVVEGNRHKFGQHEVLSKFLAETGSRVLVEASPTDAVWGIGMGADHPDVKEPGLWKGENLLGYALMEVRDKMK